VVVALTKTVVAIEEVMVAATKATGETSTGTEREATVEGEGVALIIEWAAILTHCSVQALLNRDRVTFGVHSLRRT
jgi:hypothetical protein